MEGGRARWEQRTGTQKRGGGRWVGVAATATAIDDNKKTALLEFTFVKEGVQIKQLCCQYNCGKRGERGNPFRHFMLLPTLLLFIVLLSQRHVDCPFQARSCNKEEERSTSSTVDPSCSKLHHCKKKNHLVRHTKLPHWYSLCT